MSHIFQLPDDIYTELVTYASQHGQTPDGLLITLVKEGVEQLKQTDSLVVVHNASYNPALDPLAPFNGFLPALSTFLRVALRRIQWQRADSGTGKSRFARYVPPIA